MFGLKAPPKCLWDFFSLALCLSRNLESWELVCSLVQKGFVLAENLVLMNNITN